MTDTDEFREQLAKRRDPEERAAARVALARRLGLVTQSADDDADSNSPDDAA